MNIWTATIEMISEILRRHDDSAMKEHRATCQDEKCLVCKREDRKVIFNRVFLCILCIGFLALTFYKPGWIGDSALILVITLAAQSVFRKN